MTAVAIVAFLVGLLLAVRVMFFGVQRRVDETRTAHRRWPLALAAFFIVAGGALYMAVRNDGWVTPSGAALVLILGFVAGAAAWLLVQRSAAIPSTDPEDDPRYRFQGHVARVIEPIEVGKSAGTGRVAFDFEGQRHDLRAVWAVEAVPVAGSGVPGSEVVIERVEEGVAYVEPWAAVEERL
jgi:hypothetical protein